MSEIVKVDGAWHLTPQLAKDMGMSLFQLKQHFAREYVIPYLAKQIDDRKLKGKARSGQGGARLGFGDIFINGQKKNIQNVTAYFDKRADNITFTDAKKNQEVAQDRAEGQYGFNPDTVKQVKFLDNVEELKAELKERTDFPKGPNDARNAEKDFHNKMRKLFRKNYRGRIQYDPNIGTNYGWPEGKSQQGFMRWQRYIYKALGEGVDGDKWHRGHGLPVNKKGTNSLSNLALEPAKSNLQTQDKEGTYREPEELDRVYVAHGKSEALQEYLAFADDDKILTPMDLPPKDHAALLQNVDEDPEAIFAQGLDNRYNSFEASRILPANLFSIGPKTFERTHSLTQTAGKILGGPFAKITQIDETINQLGQGNTIGAATSAAKVLTVTENIPFIPFSENRNLPSSNY
tara:strand:- start:236 stop:1447 length:1212 start_codon:yes stop_codon:yes gene_type:complete